MSLAGVPRRLDDRLIVLSVALAQWATRDDSRAQPQIREAASTALDAIDGMTRQLAEARSVLLAEIRASDDAAATRVDALLADRTTG